MVNESSPDDATATSKAGRPSKYRPEYSEIAERAVADGATRADLAETFEVSASTLQLWLAEIPEFSRAIKRGEAARRERAFEQEFGTGDEPSTEFPEFPRSIKKGEDAEDRSEAIESVPSVAPIRTEADAQRELAALRNELATIGAEYDDAALTAQRTGEDAAVATVERLTARRAMLEGAVRAVERELPTLRAQDQARARAALEQEFAAAKDAAKQIVTQEAEAWQALYGAWLRVVALKPPLEELQAARGHVLFPFFRDGPNRLGSVAGLSLSVLPDALIQALHQWDGRTTENWAGSIDYSAKRLCEQIDRLALPPTATGPARSYVEVMKDLTPVRSSFGVAVT